MLVKVISLSKFIKIHSPTLSKLSILKLAEENELTKIESLGEVSENAFESFLSKFNLLIPVYVSGKSR